jgi:hypothetical protein
LNEKLECLKLLPHILKKYLLSNSAIYLRVFEHGLNKESSELISFPSPPNVGGLTSLIGFLLIIINFDVSSCDISGEQQHTLAVGALISLTS